MDDACRQVSAKPGTMPRIGVALGGGSARGYAHIGALASLENHSYFPSLISGTSFGAVIGAFYAMGHSIEQLTLDAKNTRTRDVIGQVTDFGLHKAALFSGDRLEHYYDRLTEGRHFSDLEKELIIVTTDIDSGELVLISEGPLAPAIRASCSMPGVFAPVEINGRRLVDGGLAAPIPLATLEGFSLDIAIGIGAGTTSKDSGVIKMTQKLLSTDWGSRIHQKMHNSVKTHPLSRLGRGLAYTANTYMIGQPDQHTLQVHTNPPISWLHFHKAEQAIRAGEAALNAFMPKIMQAFSLLPAPALAAD
ncbi:MAG: patatin-like phospholipase family protein [Trueperaceae bacterium]|nr:patatin-like phospholipase family protein [Trueperaceae bacterium]